MKNKKEILDELVLLALKSSDLGYKNYPKRINKNFLEKQFLNNLPKTLKKTSIDNLMIIIINSYNEGYRIHKEGLPYYNRRKKVKKEIRKELKEALIAI